MSRRTRAADAEAAIAAASAAARTLQQRGQEVRQQADPETEPTKPEATTSPDRIEKLLGGRTHVQAMEEILAKRGIKDEPPAEEPKVEPKPEAKPQAEEKPAAEAPAEAPPAEEPTEEAPQTVKLKVDGEEFDVPQAEVDEAGGEKAWRINKAQENRLKKINEAAAESRAREERMTKLVEAMLQQNAPKPQPKVTDEQFIAERVDKIRFGTPEESAAALREIISRGQPQIDQQAIIHQTSANLKHDMADAQFRQEFADVLANPMGQKLSAVLHGEALAPYKQPNGSVNWQALSALDWGLIKRNIGNQLRSAFGKPSQAATTTDKKPADNPSPAADKEARKASIVNLPKAAARAELPKEDKPLSPEEERAAAFASAKKARGQG